MTSFLHHVIRGRRPLVSKPMMVHVIFMNLPNSTDTCVGCMSTSNTASVAVALASRFPTLTRHSAWPSTNVCIHYYTHQCLKPCLFMVFNHTCNTDKHQDNYFPSQVILLEMSGAFAYTCTCWKFGLATFHCSIKGRGLGY